MKIPNTAHRQHSWLVHQLATDFEIEDVWEFPIKADPAHGQDFALFRDAFETAMSRLSRRGPAGALFRLRSALGRTFGWDTATAAQPAVGRNSLRQRYLNWIAEQPDQADRGQISENLTPDRAPGEAFRPVYDREQESLAEIANKTVHAALHLGWVRHPDGSATAQLAVYVKPKGTFGKCYMALIKPFRLWIVYPTIMRETKRAWRAEVEHYTNQHA